MTLVNACKGPHTTHTPRPHEEGCRQPLARSLAPPSRCMRSPGDQRHAGRQSTGVRDVRGIGQSRRSRARQRHDEEARQRKRTWTVRAQYKLGEGSLGGCMIGWGCRWERPSARLRGWTRLNRGQPRVAGAGQELDNESRGESSRDASLLILWSGLLACKW